MDTDERSMSLMAVAEDQQDTVTQLIEASRQREQEQHKAFVALLAVVEDEHKALNAQYEKNLYQQSTRLADRLDWTTLWLSAGVTFLVCVMIVLVAYLYLGFIVDKTNIAETRYEELKNHNAKLSSCTYEEKKYPCLSVKTSWGAYGDGTVFILETE